MAASSTDITSSKVDDIMLHDDDKDEINLWKAYPYVDDSLHTPSDNFNDLVRRYQSDDEIDIELSKLNIIFSDHMIVLHVNQGVTYFELLLILRKIRSMGKLLKSIIIHYSILFPGYPILQGVKKMSTIKEKEKQLNISKSRYFFTRLFSIIRDYNKKIEEIILNVKYAFVDSYCLYALTKLIENRNHKKLDTIGFESSVKIRLKDVEMFAKAMRNHDIIESLYFKTHTFKFIEYNLNLNVVDDILLNIFRSVVANTEKLRKLFLYWEYFPLFETEGVRVTKKMLNERYLRFHQNIKTMMISIKEFNSSLQEFDYFHSNYIKERIITSIDEEFKSAFGPDNILTRQKQIIDINSRILMKLFDNKKKPQKDIQDFFSFKIDKLSL